MLTHVSLRRTPRSLADDAEALKREQSGWIGIVLQSGFATELELWGVALHPAENGGWIDADPTLLHYVGQVTVADTIFAVPADAQQDDLDRKSVALED
jgi:hypothetical protein